MTSVLIKKGHLATELDTQGDLHVRMRAEIRLTSQSHGAPKMASKPRETR